jgi:hypothetical protein
LSNLPPSNEHSKLARSDDVQVNSGEELVVANGLLNVITGAIPSKTKNNEPVLCQCIYCMK